MEEESYTSTLPAGRTACTEPQFLYKGAPYLIVTHRRLVFRRELILEEQPITETWLQAMFVAGTTLTL
jgi:hypothetical protein